MGEYDSPRRTGRERINERSLVGRHRVIVPRSQALSSIIGDCAIDDRAAVNAFPGVENEEEV